METEMESQIESLRAYLQKHLADKLVSDSLAAGELTLEVLPRSWLDVCNFLRHDERTQFAQLTDLCSVDYLTYGKAEWDVEHAGGFSRAVQAPATDPFAFGEEKPAAYTGKRFAVVIHLLSITNNQRIRLRTFCDDNHYPVLPSLVRIWASANWYEREAFDLFGIMFNYHPDLRRLLTDYGFVGHPFRKDFPLSGHVEMRYDPLQQRVVYEPVSIDPRTLVPRVIRDKA